MFLEKCNINSTWKNQCLVDFLIFLPCFSVVSPMLMTFLPFQKSLLSRQMIKVPLRFYNLLQIKLLCINSDLQLAAKYKGERTSTIDFVSLCYILPLLLV